MDEPEGREPISREQARAAPTARACRRILGEVASACQADGVALWILSAEGGELAGTFAHIESAVSRAKLEGQRVPVSASVIGMVTATGESISVGPDANYNRVVDEDLGTTTQAMLAAPVYIDDEVCGVLSAVRLDDNLRTFSAIELEEISWWAYLMGLVLGSGRE